MSAWQLRCRRDRRRARPATRRRFAPAQNKLKVACVDEWKNTDGSLRLRRHLPERRLHPVQGAARVLRAATSGRKRGVLDPRHQAAADVKLDLAAMQKRRAAIVKTMTGGITALFKANGVTGIQGHGRLLPGNKVESPAPTAPRRRSRPSTWCSPRARCRSA